MTAVATEIDTDEPELPFFVYGTLRPGQGNFRIVKRDVIESIPASVQGAAVWHGPGFPYAVHKDVDASLAGSGWVVGDLLYINPARYADAIDSLDGLEGVSYNNDDRGHYRRIEVDVTVSNGDGTARTVRAWMYVAGASARQSLSSGRFGPPLVTGDWLNVRNS